MLEKAWIANEALKQVHRALDFDKRQFFEFSYFDKIQLL